jgi:hypothetical protein
MHKTSRMAARAVGDEVRKAFSVEDGLGHDGARRVPGAKEESVIACNHGSLLVPTRAGRRRQYIRIGIYRQGGIPGKVGVVAFLAPVVSVRPSEAG